MLFVFTCLLNLAFLFNLDTAHAGDVDLRSYYPEIRNQGKIGNCYAQTGADLLTAYYRKNGKFMDRFVSPDAVSVCGKAVKLEKIFEEAEKNHEDSKTPEYAATQEQLGALLDEWTAYPFAHTPPTKEELAAPDYLKYMPQIEALCQKLHFDNTKECIVHFRPNVKWLGVRGIVGSFGSSVDGGLIGVALSDSYSNCGVCTQKSFGENDVRLIFQFDDELEAFSRGEPVSEKNKCDADESSVLEPENEKQLTKILRRLQEDRLKRHPALELFRKKCDKSSFAKKAMKQLTTALIDRKDVQKEITRVSSLLDQNTPVGISYDSTVVGANKGGSIPWHASSIVGKVMKDGVPCFIVRNSWGSEFCEKKLKADPSVKFTCDHGDFVVDAAALMEKTVGITYFDPAN